MSVAGRTLTPREVIASIRREQYLLDVEVSEEVARGLQSMRQDLDQALRLLSDDLYSKKSHFVLELIQNADDNDYSDRVMPKLTFSLSPTRLLVSNNEVGFVETNVRDLCRTGRSSKTKKGGYIGEKGIGFKSVFTVSDAPEIHSNGYHFKFDRTGTDNLLGYVVPVWVESDAAVDNSRTTILLPAKSDAPFEESMLGGLDSRLLLFLRKLRDLELQTPERSVVYTRRDQGARTRLTSTVTLPGAESKIETAHYVRMALDLSMRDIEESKRKDIETTALVLAFPITESGKAAPEPDCATFAFLPIRSFGFSFCVQGDFLVNASREDIHTDRPWNVRLRDSVALAFTSAIDVFKKMPELALSYLKFVPTETSIPDPFFKPVVKQLTTLLGQTECIPSASGEWRKPREILLADDSFRQLFSATDAQELLGLDYPDSDLDVDERILKRLGCRGLTYEHILSIFTSHSEWFGKKKITWKAKFYAYLSGLNREKLVVAGLKDAPCVPTTNGTLATPSQTNVFHPLSHKRQYGFEQELTILDHKIFELALAITPEVDGLFQQLNVKNDDAYEMVRSHILPKHAGEAWKRSKHEALIGHLRYIKDRIRQYLTTALEKGQTEDAAFRSLREGLWIGTKRRESESWYFGRAENLYLSREYGPAFSIEMHLREAIPPGVMISADYLPPNARQTAAEHAESEVDAWRSFLLRLGVRDAPKVEKLADGDFKCSTELEALLRSPETPVRRAVLECLDRNWASYSAFIQYRGGRHATPKDTLFVAELRSTIAPTRRPASVSLSDAYQATQECRDLFGESAAYVEAKLTNQGLLQACGITFRGDARACLKRLRQLKTEGRHTTQLLKRIYRHLEREWDRDAGLIKQAFHAEGLIRIKGERSIWVRPEEAVWRSSGHFLDSLYPPLQSHYGDFSSFFVNKLGVARELPTAKAVAALLRLAESESRSERENEALSIYKRASRDLSPRFGQDAPPTPLWLDVFRTEEVFITHHGTLVSSCAKLFVNDRPEMGRLFADEEEISLIAVPVEELARVRRLFEAAEVQFLSAALTLKVVEDHEGTTLTALQGRLRAVLGCIARVLYHHSHESFERARDEGLFRQVRELDIVEVPDLRLRVSVAGIPRTTSGDIAVSGNRVLLRRGARSSEDRVAIEICKMLRAPESLSDTVTRLLLAKDLAEAEDYLQIKSISRLPAQDEALLAVGRAAGAAEVEQCEDEREESGEAFEEARADTLDESPSLDQVLPSEQPTATPASGLLDGDLHTPTVTRGAVAAPAPASQTGQPPQEQGTPRRASEPRRPTSSPHGGPAAERGSRSSAGSGALSRSGTRYRGPHSPKRGSKGGAGQSGAVRTRRGRLLSYADSPDAEERAGQSNEDRERAAHRDAVSQAAVEWFLSTQADRWRSLQEMPRNNPGFDVQAVAHDGQAEAIEVKGQSGAWTEEGVALTPTELAHALRMRERYWLCVVEFANDDIRRRLHLVKDPFGLTMQFRFDSGWKSQAISESAQPMKPDAGLVIELPGEGVGVIVSAKSRGQFFKLHVQLRDGRQVFRTFNPATMKLSSE